MADGMSNTVGSCDDVGHTNDIAILTSCMVIKGFIFEENRVNSILALLTNAKWANQTVVHIRNELLVRNLIQYKIWTTKKGSDNFKIKCSQEHLK